MKICGLKLTHDGALAVLDDNRLLFSIEMEKIADNPRYTGIETTETIRMLLEREGLGLDEIDHFVIDGWGGYDQEALALQPRLIVGAEENQLSISSDGKNVALGIAQYHERTIKHDVMEQWIFDGLPLDGRQFVYSSYLHVTGHILSAYCCSPFAARREPSYVLVWDGGMYPRLYFVDPRSASIENLGPLFLLIGNMYTIFSQHFGPFKVKGGFAKDSLSVAGKVMAYIALGSNRPELHPIFNEVYEQHYSLPMGFANIFARQCRQRIDAGRYSDEEILCSFHHYLGDMLVSRLAKKIGRFDKACANLCVAGGCALNIKWNSDIRQAGIFQEVFVPPFPNDSGSAIGAAASWLWTHTDHRHLDWSVYSGPRLDDDQPGPDWSASHCSITRLASLLHNTGEPVVFLNGRAELGPRALGNRSMLAAATHPGMKDLLNAVKGREGYRPVSPICLEEAAADIFEPGCPDPYMLFDHRIRAEWANSIPAVLHLDGSARLQTVNDRDNPVVAALLRAYQRESGIPLLCNTSANHNGKGFFPSAASAAEWGRLNYVWSDGTLFERRDKLVFSSLYPGYAIQLNSF